MRKRLVLKEEKYIFDIDFVINIKKPQLLKTLWLCSELELIIKNTI